MCKEPIRCVSKFGQWNQEEVKTDNIPAKKELSKQESIIIQSLVSPNAFGVWLVAGGNSAVPIQSGNGMYTYSVEDLPEPYLTGTKVAS